MVVDTTEEVVVGVFIVEDGVGGSRRRNAHTVNEEDSQRDCATPEGGGADDGRAACDSATKGCSFCPCANATL